MFSDYNQKVATTTYHFPFQPPCHRSRMMEPLSHYHCEIYYCKPVPINLHQTTCTKQLVIHLYHKKVHQPCTNLYLNLYHQQVHQPCTKYVTIMHQIHIKYDSSRCTNIINYKPHICANSSTTCLNHVPNMYLNQSPHQFHHPNLICKSVIYMVYMITYLQTFLKFKKKRLAFSLNFTLVSHD
jgi:hypothetical protein